MSLEQMGRRHDTPCAPHAGGRQQRQDRRFLLLRNRNMPVLAAAVLAIGLGAAEAPAAEPRQSPECTAPAGEPVLRVGLGETHASLGSAVDAANAIGGAGRVTICVAAGTYENDFAEIDRPVRILGVGGRPHLKATVPPSNLKGILTTNADTEVVNLEISGAAISAQQGNNAAGIRFQAGDLTVRDSFIHDNQNGVMSNNDVTGTMRITGSTFVDNGAADGLSHGAYMTSRVGTMIVEDSYFEGQNEGHHVKSRGVLTEVRRSTFEDGIGTINEIPSFSIDVPGGGVATIEDNTFIQRDVTTGGRTNKFVIHYSDTEQRNAVRTEQGMTVSGNTFRNFRDPATAVLAADPSVPPVVIENNDFVDYDAVVQGSATQSGNQTSGFTAHDFGENTLVGVNAGIFPGGRDIVEHDKATGGVLASLAQPDGIAGNGGITELGGTVYVANNLQGVGTLDPVTGTSTFYSAHTGIEALGNDGQNLLAAIFETDELLVLGTDGTELARTQLFVPGLAHIGITGLDFNLDRLFVGSFLDGNIYVFDDGFTFEALIETGIGGGALSGLAFDAATETFWVGTGYGDDRLIRFALDGTELANVAAGADEIAGLFVRGNSQLPGGGGGNPVPLPATALLLLSGVGVAGLLSRRRGRRRHA